MKVEKTIWFHSYSCTTGIVAGIDEVTGVKKAYINVVKGEDEKEDIERLVKHGAPINIKMLSNLCDYLNKES